MTRWASSVFGARHLVEVERDPLAKSGGGHLGVEFLRPRLAPEFLNPVSLPLDPLTGHVRVELKGVPADSGGSAAQGLFEPPLADEAPRADHVEITSMVSIGLCLARFDNCGVRTPYVTRSPSVARSIRSRLTNPLISDDSQGLPESHIGS